MLDFIARPMGVMVKFIYDMLEFLDNPVISAYALAIIVAGVLLKLVLLPLTKKQTDSMKEMQRIQPEISKLQKKYKNDKETLNRKTMELYNEHNVNPMGGCLPLLIQFPILIGFFYVLRDPVKYAFKSQAAYDAMNKSFLWIKDLGYAANHVFEDGVVNGLGMGFEIPYVGAAIPILALIAGLTTYYQSKMMQAGQSGGNEKANSTQNMMTKFMPVMIFFFALSFPAGLTLYWTVSNLFQIVQQYIALNKSMQIKEAK